MMRAGHEEVMAEIRTNQEKMNASQEQMTVLREGATEACLERKESTSMEIESVVVHEEVPKEEH
jgi:N-acetylglutamate synthase-like GNAT family acetyltransferase